MMTDRRLLARRFTALVATVISVFPLGAMAGDVPPITDPPTGAYQRGKLVWIDLVTVDLAAARRFYGALFGWTFAAPGDGRGAYTLAYQDGVPVAGLAERAARPEQQRQARWIAFMSVADVAAAAKSVTAKGGRVLIAPRSVPARGEMAVVADPDGAPFGLINSASGDPPDGLAPMGDWIWALYQSPDATSAAAFYQDLGDYEVVQDDPLGQAPHFLLVAGGYARASLVEIPVERSSLRPDWLYFARVRNLRDSLARVRELGGSVLMEPKAEVLDERLAVIADPAGAPLGLMEWDEAHGEEQ